MDKAYDINKEAVKRVQKYISTYTRYRTVAKDDIRVVNGDPWTEDSKARRGNRPMEIINTSIINKRKVKEDYKKRQASIKVSPVDNKTDTSLARVFQGIVDQISRDSMADTVMDRSFDDMLSCGMGFCYVDTEWENDYSHDQKITINYLDDPFSVFFDVDSKLVDYSDAEWGGWIFTTTSEEYENEYPDYVANNFPVQDSNITTSNNESYITLCRYYRVEYYDDTLISVIGVNGEIVNICVSELRNKKNSELLNIWSTNEDFDSESIYSWLNKSGKIIKERTLKRRKVRWYILNGMDILAEGDWAGKYIPIIPTYGDKYYLDNDCYFWSLVRAEKDPVRMYNYFMSNMSEFLASKPVAQWIGDPRKVEGYERIWANANNLPVWMLPTKPIEQPDGTVDNSPLLPLQGAEVPAGWMSAADIASQNKRNTSGYQESALDLQGSDASGRAILARYDNSLSTISVFFDNRKFSTQLLGKVIVDMIPKIYDGERTQRILGPDGQQDIVVVNGLNKDGYYKGKFLDIVNSSFDVYIDVGPSMSSQRRENQATLMEMLSATPSEYVPAVIDKLYENLDIQGTDDIVKRIQKLQPPQMNLEEGEKSQEQWQNELSQKDQQLQQMQLQISEMEKIINGDQVRSQARMQETQMKIAGDLQKESIKQDAETRRKLLDNRNNVETTQTKAISDLRQTQIQANTDLRQTQIESETDLRQQQIDAATNLKSKKLEIEGDITLQIIKQMQEMNQKIDAIAVNINPSQM